jgi:DNA gyrase subunit A
MRMPLIDGQGNLGTVDGDSAAAYRYTEARLEPLALELLRDIEKDTVNFSLNFSDELEEPDTLPGRYPNLLVNGAYGIAVGLATNIPTHNLAEVIDGTVAYIDNPKIKLDSLMRHIKGPDFPTGAYIIADEELKKAYQTGKGKIKIRARVNIEKDTGDKKMLVITEIPYQVNKANLLKSIADLKEDKNGVCALIHDVVDESDRNGIGLYPPPLRPDVNSLLTSDFLATIIPVY